MDEIRQLQEKLALLQVRPSVHRLSERNVVEILQKLKTRGLIQPFVHTTNGKEVVTKRQLEREITDTLFLKNHRVSLTELCTTLDMDLSKVTEGVESLLKKGTGIRLVAGEIIAREFITNMMEEVAQTLSELGLMSLTEISNKFQIPIEVVEDAVTSQIATLGTLSSGIVYTSQFVAKHRAGVVGCLNALTKPMSVSLIQTKFGFKRDLFSSTVEELMTEGRVAGSISGKGDNLIYTPECYTHALRDQVSGFYTSNGFVEFSLITKLKLTSSSPKDYLRQKYPEGIPLESVFVSPLIISSLNDQVEECISSGDFLDTVAVLPSPFSSEDVAAIVSSHVRVKPDSCLILRDRFVISLSLLRDLRTYVEESVKEQVKRAFSAAKTNPAQKDTALSLSPAVGSDSDSEGASKKAPKGKKSKKITVVSNNNKGKSSMVFQWDGSEREIPLSLLQEIIGKYRAFNGKADEGRGDPSDLVEPLSLSLSSPANEALERERKSHREISHLPGNLTKQEIKSLRSKIEERLQGEYENLVLMSRSLEREREREREWITLEMRETLERSAVRSGSEALSLSIQAQLVGMMDLDTLKISTFAERKAFVLSLSPDVREKLLPLVEGHESLSLSLEGFISLLEDAVDHAGLKVKRPDKKRERALLLMHAEASLQSLRESVGKEREREERESFIPALCALVSYLYIKVRKALVYPTRKTLGLLIRSLEPPQGSTDKEYLPLNLAENLKNCLEKEENQNLPELLEIAQNLKIEND